MRLLVFAVLAIAAVSGNDEPHRKCKPGTQYETIVRTFYCKEDGSGYNHIVNEQFKKMYWIVDPKEGIPPCVPGRIWLNYDTICVCPNDASRSICTNTIGSKELDLSYRICHAGNSTARGSSIEDAKICNPGDIVYGKINICACTSNGSGWICANSVDSIELQLSATRMSHRNNLTYSAADTERQVNCTPGDVVVADDNGICTCVNDGKGWICAITVASQSLHLSSNICHSSKNSNLMSPSTANGNLCNAGDSFVLNNEMCVCVSDRTGWICYNTVGTEKLHISSKIGQRNDSSSGVASEGQMSCSPGVSNTDGNTVCCCVDDGSGWICVSTVGSEMLHLTSKMIGNPKHSKISHAATEGQMGCSPGDCYTYRNLFCCCVDDGFGWVCGRTIGSQNFNLTRKSVDAEKPIYGSSSKDVENCNAGDAVVEGNQICVCGSDGSGWICTGTVGSDKLHLSLMIGNRNDSITSGLPTKGQLGCSPGACYTNGNIACCCTSYDSGWICGKAVVSEKLHLTSKTGKRNGSITSSSPTAGQVGCSPGDCYTNGNKILFCCVSDGSDWICGETVGSKMLHLTSKTDNRLLRCRPNHCYNNDDKILCCCRSDGSGWRTSLGSRFHEASASQCG